MRSWVQPRAALLLLLLSFGLGACGALVQEKPPGPAGEQVRRAPVPESPPPEKPEPPGTSRAYSLEAARPFPPENLTGLSQQEARVLFGPPSIVSQDPPAEVWRYAFSPDCLLTMFFYLDVSASAWRVLTYEVKPENGDDAKCIGALYERHAANS